MVSLLNGLNLSNPDENTEKNIKDIVNTAILEIFLYLYLGSFV